MLRGSGLWTAQRLRGIVAERLTAADVKSGSEREMLKTVLLTRNRRQALKALTKSDWGM